MTRSLDSTLDPTPGESPGLSDIYEKRIMNFPAANRRKHGQLCSVTPDCQLYARALFSASTFSVFFFAFAQTSFCLLSWSAFSLSSLSLLLLFLSLLFPHACLAKPTGHRCSKPLYLTRNGPSYTRTAHLSTLLLVCIATTRVYFFLSSASLPSDNFLSSIHTRHEY